MRALIALVLLLSGCVIFVHRPSPRPAPEPRGPAKRITVKYQEPSTYATGQPLYHGGACIVRIWDRVTTPRNVVAEKEIGCTLYSCGLPRYATFDLVDPQASAAQAASAVCRGAMAPEVRSDESNVIALDGSSPPPDTVPPGKITNLSVEIDR